MIRTPDLGLVVWNNELDPYNSQELGNNFSILNDHDHTPGKGKPISTGALADSAVTTAKLSNNAVTASKIEAQQTWQSLALPAGWSTSLQYYKDSLGIVHVRPEAITAPGTPPASGATLCTFPAGYRPGVTSYFNVRQTATTNNVLMCSVTTGGALQWGPFALPASVPVAFLVSFRAEN